MVTVEFLAHLSGDQWAKIPTRLERFQILKELEDEVRRLRRTYVLRKTTFREDSGLRRTCKTLPSKDRPG